MINNRVIKNTILSLLLSMATCNAAAGKNEPPEIGNFSLRSSQQPGSFLSMGQNIVDKNVTQLYAQADDVIGTNQHFIDLIPSIVYGITDQFSANMTLPLAISYQQEDNHSSGLEDITTQFEYAYHVKSTSRFSEQATILANITWPTGSTEKQPATGIGAASFLLGTTYIRTYCDWYGFVSPGVILTTSHDDTKYGNKYLYQFGIGRNIYSKPSKMIFAGLLEVDGQYSKKDTIQDERDNNSGGNIISLTPSIWFSTNKLIFQMGVGFPVIQNLYGEQTKNHFTLVGNLGWTL